MLKGFFMKTNFGFVILLVALLITSCGGGSSGSSESSQSTLQAPSNLVAAVAANTIDLTWSDNSSNEDGFKIERSTTADSGFTEVAMVAADTTHYSDAALSFSTTYYYRVRAYTSLDISTYSNTTAAVTSASFSLSPESTFARVGVLSTSIPDPLTVTLAYTPVVDTFVSLIPSDPTALSIPGGGVTVLAGNTNATVQMSGLTQASAVTVTATLDTDIANASVRVVDASEVPQAGSLTSTTDTVSQAGTLTMTVMLDIPAPAGGTVVTMAADAGTVPATVTILENHLSADFDYLAASSPGTVMISASAGGNIITANITIN